jgi:hypothetical protein
LEGFLWSLAAALPDRLFEHPANHGELYSISIDDEDGDKDSPTYSDSDTDFARGLVRLIRYLGLNERMQALIFLSGSKELEGNAASTHRMDHRGDLKRWFTFTKQQLQIEDIVLMNLSLTLDDTAAH